jgi:hypothetical protein
MKNFLWVSIAFVLLPVAAWPQALPDNPSPAPFDPRWNHIERLSDGQRIVVLTTNGAKVRCRFAGATDTCLFCDQPGVLSSQPDYRFDRADIVSVKESQPEHNWHPGLLAAVAIVGTAVGIAATRNMDDRGAAAAGLLTAGFVGAVGYPIVQMQSENAGFGFVYRPQGFGLGAAWPPGPRFRMRFPIGRRR